MITLYPMQSKIVGFMVNDLEKQHYSFLKCGQRSGKSVMVWNLLGRTNYKRVRWITAIDPDPTSMETQERLLRKEIAVPSDLEIFYRWTHPLEYYDLLIIDEAMFIKGSYTMFECARAENIDVIVVSSNGPEYTEDKRWQLLKGHSYASWEINPTLTRDCALLRNLYDKDPIKARRDFEGY